MQAFRLSPPLTLDGLEQVFTAGDEHLDRFAPFAGGEEYLHLRRANLPDLAAVPAVRDVVVEGLVADDPPWPILRTAARRGAEVVGEIGLLRVSVGFEEAGSRQTGNDTADHALVGISRGRSFFGYSAGASRVLQDAAYRRDFMERVAGSGLLPLEMEERDGRFRLDHSDGGQFHATQAGAGGWNPSAFRCYAPGQSDEDLVELLQCFVEEFGSGALFAPKWIVSVSRGGQSREQEWDESRTLVRRMRETPLPAAELELTVTVYVGSVEDVAELSTLAAALGETVELPIADFRFHDRTGQLVALAAPDGVGVGARGAGAYDPDALASALGLVSPDSTPPE